MMFNKVSVSVSVSVIKASIPHIKTVLFYSAQKRFATNGTRNEDNKLTTTSSYPRLKRFVSDFQ